MTEGQSYLDHSLMTLLHSVKDIDLHVLSSAIPLPSLGLGTRGGEERNKSWCHERDTTEQIWNFLLVLYTLTLGLEARH